MLSVKDIAANSRQEASKVMPGQLSWYANELIGIYREEQRELAMDKHWRPYGNAYRPSEPECYQREVAYYAGMAPEISSQFMRMLEQQKLDARLPENYKPWWEKPPRLI